MNASECRESLLALTQRMLTSLAAPALAPFLADWPGSPATPATPAAHGSRGLPVMRWVTRIAADNHGFYPELVSALCRAAPLLEWRQTYAIHEVGAEFLRNYGWSEILSPSRRGGGAEISCGVILLGPDTFYPHHRHEAEEIYVPLSGTAAWEQGDAIWRQHPPGTLIHHVSEEPHAMRTGAEPLLAMYLWRSAELSQEARLDRRPG